MLTVKDNDEDIINEELKASQTQGRGDKWIIPMLWFAQYKMNLLMMMFHCLDHFFKDGLCRHFYSNIDITKR